MQTMDKTVQEVVDLQALQMWTEVIKQLPILRNMHKRWSESHLYQVNEQKGSSKITFLQTSIPNSHTNEEELTRVILEISQTLCQPITISLDLSMSTSLLKAKTEEAICQWRINSTITQISRNEVWTNNKCTMQTKTTSILSCPISNFLSLQSLMAMLDQEAMVVQDWAL